MKTLTISTKEYMLLRELALKYAFEFAHTYNKENKMVEVEIAEEFCEAFGW